MSQSSSSQTGVAMILALFIVALVASMAAAMLARLERDIVRLQLLSRHTQAENDAQGSVAWAMDQLAMNWIRQKVNRQIDVMPMQLPVNNVNGYQITTRIEDMQSRFNLNNISQPAGQQAFIRLLQVTSPTLPKEKAQEITKSVVDWLAKSGNQNNLNQYYANQMPPYQAAHQKMLSPSELKLVKGMTPAIWQAIKPYLTALPTKTPVNIQTAPIPILMTLNSSMTMDVAKAIIQWRSTIPVTSVALFLNNDVIKNHKFENLENITVVSQYFLVTTIVSIEKQTLVLYTLIHRVVHENHVLINILWQSKGIW